jgi:hypothetical protein
VGHKESSNKLFSTGIEQRKNSEFESVDFIFHKI